MGDEPDRWRSLDVALHGFFAHRVADPQSRADLVQEVLLRMHERREQLRDEDRFEAWAFRIARNALVDHYRRHRSSEELPELSEPEPETADHNAELLGSWLRVRIGSLPDSYREALELTELRGLSQREAAELLGVPYSTLKSRVQRGRDLLHADLLRCCAVELDARGRVTDFEPRSGKPCGCKGQ
ncbi:MAG TPA: sigma-70 family RNA polymerase sigma factor [Enhygromyxa sp.]|nr:sigma-70 family RNA polymerase sigma factor [Enhygromyxa sp.]